MFHVYYVLKKALSPSANPQPLPPMLSKEVELQVTPAVKAVQNTTHRTAEVLI